MNEDVADRSPSVVTTAIAIAESNTVNADNLYSFSKFI